MKELTKSVLVAIVIMLVPVVSAAADEYETMEECLADAVKTAPENLTIGELKAQCMKSLKKFRKGAEGLLPADVQ